MRSRTGSGAQQNCSTARYHGSIHVVFLSSFRSAEWCSVPQSFHRRLQMGCLFSKPGMLDDQFDDGPLLADDDIFEAMSPLQQPPPHQVSLAAQPPREATGRSAVFPREPPRKLEQRPSSDFEQSNPLALGRRS